MSNDNVVLGIIDLHAILHIVKYGAMTRGIGIKEENTFLIHGFLYKLRHICTKMGCVHLVFACDSLTSKRKSIFPEYKQKRGDKTEDQIYLDSIAYPQFSEIKQYVLPTIGFRNVIEFDGYEADDVIASICKHYPRNNKLIITEDRDMYQLLSENTAIMFPRSCNYYTIDDFKEEFQIQPDKWVLVKTYGGCTSDGIPGIYSITASGRIAQKGFGEKTALKYIRGEMSRMKAQYASVNDERNKDIIERNRRLVTLPYEGTPRVKIRSNSLSYSGFLDVVERYGFNTMGEDALEFKRIWRLK